MLQYSKNMEKKAFKVFSSIPLTALSSLIADMENQSYALTYIHSNTLNDSSYHYSLVLYE